MYNVQVVDSNSATTKFQEMCSYETYHGEMFLVCVPSRCTEKVTWRTISPSFYRLYLDIAQVYLF